MEVTPPKYIQGLYQSSESVSEVRLKKLISRRLYYLRFLVDKSNVQESYHEETLVK